jgi:hypothetical protein
MLRAESFRRVKVNHVSLKARVRVHEHDDVTVSSVLAVKDTQGAVVAVGEDGS